MKLIKRVITIVSLCIVMIVLVSENIKAAETTSAKKLVKNINNQLSTAKNITAKAYLGKINQNNYLSTVAVNTKDNILYADWYILGRDKFYIYKDKMYTYSTTEKKWKSQKVSKKNYTSNYNISTESKTKLLGNSTFERKSCLALQVKNGTTKSVYYVNKKDNRLIGIVTATGSKKVYTTIDTKTNVKVPSYVLDGRKMNCDTNIKEDIKVTAISINGKVDDIKITTYSQLTKLINKIKKSMEYKSNKEGMSGVISTLESYDKKYFKTKSLYLKNYKNCQPESLYAVKKSASSGKMSIILTGYYEPDRVYLAITQPYIVFIEADSKAASSIKNVKISYDKNQYIVPNVKSK